MDSHQADAGDPELEEGRRKLRLQISTHVGFRINDTNCTKKNSLFCVQSIEKHEKYISLNIRNPK